MPCSKLDELGLAREPADIGEEFPERAILGKEHGLQGGGFGDKWGEILQRCKRERGFGDFWGHMLVARVRPRFGGAGCCDLGHRRAEVIVGEAGGKITGFTGPTIRTHVTSPSGDGTALTTNGALHAELVAALEDGSPDPFPGSEPA